MRVLRPWGAASIAVAIASLVQGADLSAIPASSGIEVQDNLLSSVRVDPAMLLPHFPRAPRDLQADASSPALDHISSAMQVPMRLYHRLQASLSPVHAPRPRSLGPSRAQQVPTKRSVGGYDEHQDHFKADELGQRQQVDGRVGVLYLAGGGRMVFTEQETQESVAVNVQPGRFVSWPNDRYQHRLEADGSGNPRLMLGPMAVNPSSGLLEAVGIYEPECKAASDCGDTIYDKCCGGECYYTEYDDENCGVCKKKCPPLTEDEFNLGSFCDEGRCTCDGSMCGGLCMDTVNDPDNCGRCGKRCDDDAWCEDGVCKCPYDTCGDECVQLDEDTAHCGLCGNKCPPGTPCVSGKCVCPEGASGVCGPGCADFQTDKANCGACDNVCRGDLECISGKCDCPWSDLSELTNCANQCVDLLYDKDHCGDCNTVCSGELECDGGECVCMSYDLTNCGNKCLDLLNNKAHCGACNAACPAHLDCVDGVCACPDGLSDCEGKCMDLATKGYCGSCGTVCASDQLCTMGTCKCPDGMTQCNGVCVDLKTSLAHCGACSSACPAGESCSAGKCSCAGTQCNGKCTDTDTDSSNCGGCGQSCPGGTPCTDGSCGMCMHGQYETKAAKCANIVSLSAVGQKSAITRLPATVTFDMKIRNYSPSPLDGAIVSFTFPPGIEVESTPVAAKSRLANSATASNRLIVALPTVPPGKKSHSFKTTIKIVSATAGRHSVITSVDFKSMSIKAAPTRINVKLPAAKPIKST